MLVILELILDTDKWPILLFRYEDFKQMGACKNQNKVGN